MMLLPCQTSDLRMTGSLPTVSLPVPSTDTMSSEYIPRMTSKCFPWLHSSMNFPATVSTLMAISFPRGSFCGDPTSIGCRNVRFRTGAEKSCPDGSEIHVQHDQVAG